MRLAIVIGHNERLKGARIVAPVSSFEYDYNLRVAEEIVRYADKAHDIDVGVFFHDEKIVGSRRQRDLSEAVAREISKWEAGRGDVLSIELHTNAFNGKAFGTETLYARKHIKNKSWAQTVQKHVSVAFARTGSGNRGVKSVDDFARGGVCLRYQMVPACLVEPAFGDNPAEAKLLSERLKNYAQSLVEAAVEFWEGT